MKGQLNVRSGVRVAPNLHKRFSTKYSVILKTGCWEWTAGRHKQGYGWIRDGKLMRLAHQVSYELFRGRIPTDKNVLHKCDNPCCVNPDHLFLGTHIDNMRDASKKFRFDLSKEVVQSIRRDFSDGISERQICHKYKISRAAAYRIRYRKAYTN